MDENNMCLNLNAKELLKRTYIQFKKRQKLLSQLKKSKIIK